MNMYIHTAFRESLTEGGRQSPRGHAPPHLMEGSVAVTEPPRREQQNTWLSSLLSESLQSNKFWKLIQSSRCQPGGMGWEGRQHQILEGFSQTTQSQRLTTCWHREAVECPILPGVPGQKGFWEPLIHIKSVVAELREVDFQPEDAK